MAEVFVTASADDAEQITLTPFTMDLTSSDLEFGRDTPGDQAHGMRFLNWTIPVGSTITSAYVQYEVATDTADTGSPDITYYGEVDDTGTFTSTASNITDRTYTTASVQWNTIALWPTAGARGADQQTPDLSAIIQEVIDDAAWASGNAIVIIQDDNLPAHASSDRRRGKSWDFATGTGAASLIIEYTAGSTSSCPTFKYSEVGS